MPVILGIIAVILILIPQVVSLYNLILISTALVLILFALSFNLIFGYMGFLSLMHGVFFGLGAYAVALGLTSLPILGTISFPLAILLGILLSLIVAVPIGFITARVSGMYSAMFTLAVAAVFKTIIYSLKTITQGGNGVVPPLPNILYISSLQNYYYLIVAVVLISAVIMYKIVNSSFGEVLKAIRENEDRVDHAGINTKRIHMINFSIAAVFAAVSGGLYTCLIGYIGPESVGVTRSVQPLIMSLLGGMGSFIGPVVGGLIMIIGKEIITSFTTYWYFVLGVIMAVVVIVMPKGIVGTLKEQIREYL